MSRKLVAYFSATGTPARLAETLAEAIGADIFEIEPEIPYTQADLNWQNTASRSSVEMKNPSSRPAVAGRRDNMADYEHKKDRVNNYGGSDPASPMDLNDEDAQNLLNNAILVDGRLYGRKNNKNYAFQPEQPGVYHGYIADDLPDHVVRALDANYKLWK